VSDRFDWFRVLALIPLGSLIGILFYVRTFEGWGAWAAAPLLLLPPLLSLPTTAIGVRRILAERAEGAVSTSSLACTALAAAPLAWLLWRWLVAG